MCETEYTKIKIFRNSLLIQLFDNETIEYYYTHFAAEPATVTDFKNDSRIDFKIVGSIWGADTYGGGFREIYFLQDSREHFTKISSFFTKQPLTEGDVDNDSIFTIVSCTFDQINGHSYWIYNLFKFTKDDLVDVNKKHGYPIFIQELFRENHKLANDIPASLRRQFMLSKPLEYLRDRGEIYH